MNTKSIIVALTALAGLAAMSAPASAMPVGAAPAAAPAVQVEKVVLVCNAYGRCWRRPAYYAPYGYYGRPRYYGYYGPRRYYGYRRW